MAHARVLHLPDNALLPELALPNDVQRFAGEDAPPMARDMLARGLTPLPPWGQIVGLHQLIHGADGALAELATSTLAKLHNSVLEAALASPLPPVVLDTLARHLMDNPKIATRILLNPNLAEETVVYVASKGEEHLTELIAQNQARLIASPAIVEALYFNPKTRMSTVDRVVDFAARHGAQLDHLPGFKEVLAAIKEQAYEPTPPPETAQTVDDLLRETAEAPEEEPELDEAAGPEEEEERSMNLAAQIQNMTVPQKVRTALLGSQSARAILIQDHNKVVSRAAIRSPRVSDKEVLSFCKMRSLDRELISYIAGHREWTRKYQVKLLLVQHPKTPLAASLTFLKALRTSDLRQLARSKSIPQAVARAAKQLSTSKR